MSIAISLVSLTESSLPELAGGLRLIDPKLNKAFMTQAVSVASQRRNGNDQSSRDP